MTPSKELLEIRLNKLEEDCTIQPQTVFLWCQELAGLRQETKLKKNQVKLKEVDLKMVYAKISLDIRRSPLKFGLEKATDSSTDAAVLSSIDYDEALSELAALQKELIAAEYEEEIMDAFVDALKDRKDELRNLVLLHGQQYWAKPDTTGPMREDAMKEVNKGMRRGMKG